MKIKLTVLSILCLLLSISTLAQNYKADIQKRFKEFNDLVINGEYSKSMDYIPDVFFKVIPKDQLIATSKQLLNNKQLEYKILDVKINDVQDSKKIDSNYYALLRYTTIMTIKFLVSEPETPGEQVKRLDLTKRALEQTFGASSVKLNDSTGVFTLTPTKKSYAISQNGKTGWKFINVESSLKGFMEKVLPAEILENF